MALLGSCIIDLPVMDEVACIIRSPADFYDQRHQLIYECLLHLYRTDNSRDIVALNRLLTERGYINKVGGVKYVIGLAESVPSSAAAPHYAKVVVEKAKHRAVMLALASASSKASDWDGPVVSLADKIASDVTLAAGNDPRSDPVSRLDTILTQVHAEVLARKAGKSSIGIPTGHRDIDDIIGGMGRGQYIIVAGAASMGKTSLAMGIADDVCRRGIPVGVLSLEMSPTSLGERLLSLRSNVVSRHLRHPRWLNQDNERDLQLVVTDAPNTPMYIADCPSLSIEQMHALCRRMVGRHEVQLLVLDYLQLMAPPPRQSSREREVATLSQAIRTLTRELKTPMLVLSQLNRGVAGREDKRPTMSDLRDSGSLEQDADVILMVYREAYYHRHDPQWQTANQHKLNEAEVLIGKNRNGAVGVVPMIWDGEHMAFRDKAIGVVNDL